jgi:hypothetical protein
MFLLVAHAPRSVQKAVEGLCGRFLDFSTVPLSLDVLGGVGEEESTAAPAALWDTVTALASLLASRDDVGAGAVGVELSTEEVAEEAS